MEIELRPLPMDEAIEFWRDKVALTPDQFLSLSNEVRIRAFTIAGIGALNLLNDIMSEIDRAIAEGLTMQEWRARVNDMLERRGWEGLSPYRADNIFRTNVQTAFNVGRFKQMTQPEILRKRPYWMYDAVNDKRTRPTHLALDRRVYPADHPFWNTWYPPNGYRCRCSVRSLSDRDLKRLGLTVYSEIPAFVEPPGQAARPLMPDPGFAFNPARASWEPDLRKYPEALRQAYEARRRPG